MAVIEAEQAVKVAPSGLTPWLKWAGGKRALAPRLVPEIMATKPKLYIEPFLGGGAIALALPPGLSKVLVDINQHLIDCWLCMREIPSTLVAEVASVEVVHGNSKAGYLAARDEFNQMIANPRRMWARRSALFFYLNARCFNGLWRTNGQGLFNVPFGDRKSPSALTLEEALTYSGALSFSDLVTGDFREVLVKLFGRHINRVRGDLGRMRTMLQGIAVYCDPPYDGEAVFDGYAKGGFPEIAQRQLAALLSSYAASGAAVWATNADTPLVRELYSWAQLEEIDERHIVGSKPNRRGQRKCLLIRGGSGK